VQIVRYLIKNGENQWEIDEIDKDKWKCLIKRYNIADLEGNWGYLGVYTLYK
jgi:hypothetical protein